MSTSMKETDLVTRIKIDERYTIILDPSNEHFRFLATRNGENWRNLVGDNLILAMFYRIQELEKRMPKK